MRLVERHVFIKNSELEQLCFNSARLYNYCNYLIRQHYFETKQQLNEYELSGRLGREKQFDFINLPSNTSQQVIRLLFKNWKSFFKALKGYKKTPSKYSGCPRIPKYKDKKGLNIAIFTKTQVSIKNGYVNFPKKTNIKPLKTKVKEIQQIRVVPQATCFVIEIIYEKQIQKNENIKEENFLSIDLGLGNIITTSNNVGITPFIINGKTLKSFNHWFNKKRAKLLSYIGDKGTSNRFKNLNNYRNFYIEDKLHKISRFVINYCIDNRIGTIVIGHNKQWKQNVNLGKKTNQKFVEIPHSKLIDKVRYKAELVGIKVMETEESYTSKIDHLAYEPMRKQDEYIGKRKYRGLFQSSIGKLINADCNGSMGIARKVFGDSCISEIINSGLAFNPVRINIF